MVAVVLIVVLGGIILVGGGHTLTGFGTDLKEGKARVERMSDDGGQEAR